MRSKPARSQGGGGGGVVHLLTPPPQGHSACNKIYVQEPNPSFAGALQVQSSLPAEKGSQWRPLAARPGWSHMQQEWGSVPAVVFDHVVEFNDVLPLFVLLAALEGLFLKGGERLSFLEQGPSQQGQREGGAWVRRALFHSPGNCLPEKPSHLPIDAELVLTDGADSSLSDGCFLKDTVGSGNEDMEVSTGPRGYKLGARVPILGPTRVSWPTEFNRSN